MRSSGEMKDLEGLKKIRIKGAKVSIIVCFSP